MKYLLFICTFVLGSLFLSCTKNPINVKDAPKYSMVYIPQAVQKPVEARVFVLDSIQHYRFNAFYGGVLPVEKDVVITLKVDKNLVDSFNLVNNTSYNILSDAYYNLDRTSIKIPKDSFYSEFVNVAIKSSADFPAFTPYILPITLSTNDATINKDLQTVYYLVTASYAPGKIPRTKLFTLPSNYISIFQYNNSIIELTQDGLIYNFPYDAQSGVFGNGNTFGGWGWNIFNALFPLHNNFIGRWASSGTLRRYPVSSDLNVYPGMDFNSGWGIFDMLVPFKGAILARKPGSNEILAYKFNPDFSSPPNSVISLGTGWNFTNIISYGNDLLCIDQNGDMWKYSISVNFEVGARVKVGTGWNIYKKVFSFDSKLIGIDNTNTLWKYNFDLRGFWAL